MADDVFSSWKEIGAYLNKSVRTVQRWEATLGLPVHRPAARGVVLAYQSELDAWAGRTLTQGGEPTLEVKVQPRAGYAEIHRRASVLRETAVAQMERLRETGRRSAELYAQIATERSRRAS